MAAVCIDKFSDMLLLQTLREEKEKVLLGLKKRNFPNPELVDQAIEADAERRKIQSRLDAFLAEVNQQSRQIGELMKSGKKEEAMALREQAGKNKEQEQELKNSIREAEENIKNILYQLPNIPCDIVPQGKSAEDNEETCRVGEVLLLSDDALPHWELAKKYNLIDFELGVKITGAGFPVYLGKGARLQRALVQYFLDFNTEKGYLEVNPPHVINEASGYGTGQLPDKEGQMYYINEDQLYLIPTAEVPVTNIYRDVILDDAQLPVKNTAFSQCYRREAGSYGSDVRGLNRLHQFEKVEIVRLERPEDSYKALDEMVSHVQELLESLGLPFRILRLCGGDMGFTSALTYDFEVYSAAQKKWLEVSSVSNFESFQANRLKCRYRKGNEKPKLVHTLNGSALALPRIMAALLENNQTDEGIRIPEVLHRYTGFTVID